jgi:hypothetical protein
MRELLNHQKTGSLLAPLDERHMGPMEPGRFGQFLLGETQFLSVAANNSSESDFECGHGG